MPLIFLAIVAALGFTVLALENNKALLLLVVAAAVPMTLWICRRPVVLMSVVMVSQAWAVNISGDGLVTPFKLMMLLLFIVTVAGAFREGRLISPPRGFSIAFAILAIVMFISELAGPFGASPSSLFELGSTFAMYVMMTQIIRRPEDLRTIAIVVSINLVLMGCFVALEVGWAPLTTSVIRALGPPGQPNALAEHVAREVPFAIVLLLDVRNRRSVRALALTALGASVYCQFAAASRGGTLGFAVGIVTLALVQPGRIQRRALTTGALAAVMVLMVMFAPKSFDKRVLGSVRAEDQKYSHTDVTSERLEHAVLAAKMIPQHPWLGYGRAGFTGTRMYETGGQTQALHSALLSIVVAYGIPAGILYLGTILSGALLALRAARRRLFAPRYGTAVVAGVASGVVAATSSPDLFNVSFWSIVSIGYIMYHLSLQQSPESLAEEEPDKDDLADDSAVAVPPGHGATGAA